LYGTVWVTLCDKLEIDYQIGESYGDTIIDVPVLILNKLVFKLMTLLFILFYIILLLFKINEQLVFKL
jgi:hypothetical protein